MSTPSRRTNYTLLGAGVFLLILISTYSLHRGSKQEPAQIALKTLVSDPSNTLTYRNHLEEATSPPSQIVHSPTLTFDHIYVLSLPTRDDRRAQMQQLARAHGLKITFVDAVHKDAPFIRWIAERAVEVRRERLRIMAEVRGVSESSLGGLHVGNDWLVQTPDPKSPTPFPPLIDPRYPSGDWVAHLEAHDEAGTLERLHPDNPNLNITEALYDHNERIDGRQVNEGVISTFWGHSRAMKMILKNRDRSALILEDDVDVEWDLERMWSRIEKKLPRTWDATLLGHCWGKELLQPQYLHPHLHRSTAPLCLHAYALSRTGARRVLDLLLNPWTAYQTAVDTAVPSFIQFGLLESFSIEPPLIIQRKDGPSDIQQGIGSKWRGLLMDSTVERIRRSEGLEVWPDVFDPQALDPATIFRYGNGRKCHA
ncbi:glycosyltransferase family 25 protein [Sporobolomyces koalae]|uniref:glycosyltransferase family 25 protein n=1 Tax=Sporobolomyces koalae TaxID=500713 RepID=UPI00317CDFA2